MKVHSRPRDSAFARWQQHGIDRLSQAWQRLHQFFAAQRSPEAMALIPIRAVPPHPVHRSRRRAWRE